MPLSENAYSASSSVWNVLHSEQWSATLSPDDDCETAAEDRAVIWRTGLQVLFSIEMLHGVKGIMPRGYYTLHFIRFWLSTPCAFLLAGYHNESDYQEWGADFSLINAQNVL